MTCDAIFLRIPRHRISLLKFILEGYDGLAVLSTVDNGEGLVRLLVPRSRYVELMLLLNGSASELGLNANLLH